MKILIVNTSERAGGAAVAAGRLVEALCKHGVNAKMLVRDKQTGSACVVAHPKQFCLRCAFLWERLVIWIHLHLHRKRLFEIDIANRSRHYPTTRVSGSRCHSSALGQSGHAFATPNPQDSRLWKTRCLDYARHLACYGYLSPDSRLPTV